MIPVRSDLTLVRHRHAPFERAFIINDRATNRYWNTGPLQYEMARIFAKHTHWESACQELRAQFDEPLNDDEIAAAYDGFRELGLLELTEEAVQALPVRTYLRALRAFGVKEHAMLSRYTSPAELLGPARAAGEDRLIAGLHRALHMERTARENAHVPAALRWMRVQVPLFDPNAQLERWQARLRFVFTPWFFALTVVVALAGLSTYLDRAYEVHQRLSYVSGHLLLLFSCTALMLVVHEYAHAITCKHFGGEVREMGIIVFLFFLPAAYCDVSDAHLFDGRRAKLWVTVAGTWSTLVLASLGALMWSNTVPTATLNHVGLVLMATGYATVLTNLNPLLPLDGYFFLSDWLGIDNLRDRAPDYCRAYLTALFTGKPRPQESSRYHRLFFAYFFFGSLYQIFYLLLSIGFGWLILVRGGTLLGLVLYVLLVYLFYVRNYVLKLVALWREARTTKLLTYAAGAAGVIALLAFVPLPVSVSLPAVVRDNGAALEADLRERDVEQVRHAWTAHAVVAGVERAVENVHITTRAGRPVVRAGIVASKGNPATLENGRAAQLTIRSHRMTSLWRRIWGEQWDRVILDVWRLM